MDNFPETGRFFTQHALVASTAVYEKDPIAYLNSVITTHNFKSAIASTNCEQKYLIAQTDDALFIAFEGTDFNSSKDILADLSITGQQGAEGKVHSGFCHFPLHFLRESLLQEKAVILCGHSLGGGTDDSNSQFSGCSRHCVETVGRSKMDR